MRTIDEQTLVGVGIPERVVQLRKGAPRPRPNRGNDNGAV